MVLMWLRLRHDRSIGTQEIEQQGDGSCLIEVSEWRARKEERSVAVRGLVWLKSEK
jgi:hypothetical protein